MARAHRRLAKPRRARTLPLRVLLRVGCTRAGSAPPPARRAPRSPSIACCRISPATRRASRIRTARRPSPRSRAAHRRPRRPPRARRAARRRPPRAAPRAARNCAAVATPPESFSRSRAVTGHATRGEPSARSLLRRRARAPTARGAAAASARRSQSTPSHSCTGVGSRSSPRDRSRVITVARRLKPRLGCAACSLTTNCLSSAACRDAAHALLRPSACARSSSRDNAATASGALAREVPLAVGGEDGMPRLPERLPTAQLSADDRQLRRDPQPADDRRKRRRHQETQLPPQGLRREPLNLDCAAVERDFSARR